MGFGQEEKVPKKARGEWRCEKHEEGNPQATESWKKPTFLIFPLEF